MSFLRFFRRVYTLDTLDSRFTSSSRSPAKETKAEPGVDPAKPLLSESRRNEPTIQKRDVVSNEPLWGTPEFFIYYIVFIICVPMMLYVPYSVSRTSDPRYPKYEPLLSRGWIPGRKVDNSDAQYAGFRDHVPYLALLLVLHPLLRRGYDALWRSNSYTQVKPSSNGSITHGLPPSAAADARMEQRISFDVPFSFIFLFALHGVSALKIFFILWLNYQIPVRFPRKYVVPATWFFNIATLFSNELCRGYPFGFLAESLLSTAGLDASKSQLLEWAHWLDGYGGLIPRWEVLFNITVLRLISFNTDLYWSMGSRSASPVEKKQLDPSNLSERDRVSTPAKASDYSFRNYLAYTLYSPLYLTGPILTFNDYLSQLRYPLPSVSFDRTLRYGARFLVTFLTMEVVQHFIYAVAISKASPDWASYTPFQLSMLAYHNLHMIWLKLLIPWRFFRLWALIDGIDPPENMVRCMSNNYSVFSFWRNWHRSMNRWLIRYIYIPLGGASTKLGTILNTLAIFTFVALWHDLQLRLLMWGWLITLFVIPEVLATVLFPKRRWKDSPNAYRWLCGVGAVGNILMLMAANLVGFAVGLDGFKDMIEGITGSWSGLAFLAIACSALFVGSQVMFEVREDEKREGINMKC